MKKSVHSFWLLVIGSMWLLTACSIDDNPIADPVYSVEEAFYAERLVPVVDPQGTAQGTVRLRFYDDMPNVAYVSITAHHVSWYDGAGGEDGYEPVCADQSVWNGNSGHAE